MENARPRIIVPFTWLDWVLELIGLGCIIAMFWWLYTQWAAVPPVVPTHFNATGIVDDQSSRNQLWALPAIAVLLYGLITAVSRKPHLFNFPFPLTAENTARQYRNAVSMLRVLKTFLPMLFFYLMVMSVRIAEGSSTTLSPWILLVVFVVSLATMGGFILRARQLR